MSAATNEAPLLPAPRAQDSLQTNIVSIESLGVVGLCSRTDRNGEKYKRNRIENDRAPWEHTSPVGSACLLMLLRRNPGGDLDTHVTLVLRALDGGALTSIEARPYLEAVHLASRIGIPREHGHAVKPRWTGQQSSFGKSYRFGMNVLTQSPAMVP